jgi:integrator complex subunit 11
MLPLMLDDFLKVAGPGGARAGAGAAAAASTGPFTKDDIAAVLRQTVAVDLGATVAVAPGLTLTAHYAGHVLGAAMFTARAGGVTVTYTGDYNTTADRHLGPAALPRLRPDLLITESTYATTVRGPKRAREGEFVDAVVRALGRGGKVLVPVFALGRAQELMCLLDDAWARLGLTVRGKGVCVCVCVVGRLGGRKTRGGRFNLV